MSLVDTILVGWVASASGFTLVALSRLLMRRRGSARAAASGLPWPPVLLLRPVDEPTPHERSLWGHPIDYPGTLEQVVVSPLRYPLPDGVGWLRSTPASTNRKVGHLAFALATLPTAGRVVVSVDADVQVDGALVMGLIEAVRAGATVASAPPEPDGGRGLASALWRGLLVHSHLSFVSLGVMQAGAPALCGKALALGPLALGELEALAELAGEDLELARRLHRRGERITTTAVSALCPLGPGLTVEAVVQRATRWMRVLMAHRPGLAVTVPVLLAPTPLLWLLAAARGSLPLLAGVFVLTGLRSALAAWLGVRSRRRGGGGGWLVWALAEALVLVAFGRALRGGPLSWRGRTFHLEARGRLVPLAPEVPP